MFLYKSKTQKNIIKNLKLKQPQNQIDTQRQNQHRQKKWTMFIPTAVQKIERWMNKKDGKKKQQKGVLQRQLSRAKQSQKIAQTCTAQQKNYIQDNENQNDHKHIKHIKEIKESQSFHNTSTSRQIEDQVKFNLAEVYSDIQARQTFQSEQNYEEKKKRLVMKSPIGYIKKQNQKAQNLNILVAKDQNVKNEKNSTLKIKKQINLVNDLHSEHDQVQNSKINENSNVNVEYFQLPSGKLKTNKTNKTNNTNNTNNNKKNIDTKSTTFTSPSTQQTSRQFTYTQSFVLIQKCFAEFALKNKMEIIQNTSEFLTIKKRSNNNFLNFANCCLMKVCFKGDSEAQVYQLKNMSTGAGSKSGKLISKSVKSLKVVQNSSNLNANLRAKLILISGDQTNFINFWQRFTYQLFLKDYIQINDPEQVISLILKQKKQQIKNLKLKCSEFYNSFNYNKMDEKQGFKEQDLMKIFSQAKKLEQQLKKQFCMKREPISRQIDSLCKQKQQKQKHNAFQVSEQKLIKQFYKEISLMRIFNAVSKNQKNQLNKKIEFIVKKYQIQEIFSHLGIEEHHQLYININNNNNNKSKRSSQKNLNLMVHSIQSSLPLSSNISSSQFNYPYYQCVKILNKMHLQLKNQESIYPLFFLQLLQSFFITLKNEYETLYKDKMKLTDIQLDVDDQISITIFCLIFCSSLDENLLSIIRFLQVYLQIQDTFQNSCHCHRQKDMQMQMYLQHEKEKKTQIYRKILANFQASLEYIQKQWQTFEPQKQ